MYENGTAEGYDEEGFCTNYEWKDGSLVLKSDIESCSIHDNCNGYQPAALTTGEYDIDGDGDKDNSDVAYAITNAGQLYWFADKVNNEYSTYGSANAVLTKDITINSNVLNGNGELNTGDFRSWTPICESEYYTGIFDGNNKKISGLYYNVTSSKEKVYVGLFGTNTGTIKNVSIEESYLKPESVNLGS